MQYPQTSLLYLEHMFTYSDTAHIIAFTEYEGKTALILDKTIFYPQGGGQPSDKGHITTATASFSVTEVRLYDSIVYHFGTVEQGTFIVGTEVVMHVDKELRHLHSRIHTAGHLIDYALLNSGYQLEPAKGYHFPSGAYVEYKGTFDQDIRDLLQKRLSEETSILIGHNLPVTIQFIDATTRVMYLPGYPHIACGGTHVAYTSDIGTIIMRKIKNEKGYLRVSYGVEP
jgi:Ser-tRNA(Ala) deacylase AlaX